MLVFVRRPNPRRTPDVHTGKPQAPTSSRPPGPQDRGLDQHREPRRAHRLYGGGRDDDLVNRDFGDRDNSDLRHIHDRNIDDESFCDRCRRRGNRVDAEQYLDPCQLNAAFARWVVTRT